LQALLTTVNGSFSDDERSIGRLCLRQKSMFSENVIYDLDLETCDLENVIRVESILTSFIEL